MIRRAALVSLLLLAGACRKGATPTPPPPSAAVDDPPHEHPHDLPPIGPTVKVTFEGRSVDVAIASLHAGVAGAPGLVPFGELWSAAIPSTDPASLKFEAIGSDGFRPSARPKCAKLLTGAEMASARIEVTSHNLVFDDAVKLPGCYRVKAVVAVEASR